MGSCFGKPNAAVGIPVVDTTKKDTATADHLMLACVIAGWDTKYRIYLDILAFVLGMTVHERHTIWKNGEGIEKLIDAIAECDVTPRARELFGDDYPVKVMMLTGLKSLPMESIKKLVTPPIDIMMRMSHEELRAYAMWRLEYLEWAAPSCSKSL